jgi:hypothetical protein
MGDGGLDVRAARISPNRQLIRPRTLPACSGTSRARRVLGICRAEGVMRFVVPWLLGVPFSLIVLWYLISQVACG